MSNNVLLTFLFQELLYHKHFLTTFTREYCLYFQHFVSSVFSSTRLKFKTCLTNNKKKDQNETFTNMKDQNETLKT